MWRFICLFFPGFISLGIHKNIFKLNSRIDYIIVYASYNILINFIISLVCYITNSYIYDVIDNYLFTFNFSVKYLGIALILCYLLPYIVYYLKFNVKILIRRRSNEK